MANLFFFSKQQNKSKGNSQKEAKAKKKAGAGSSSTQPTVAAAAAAAPTSSRNYWQPGTATVNSTSATPNIDSSRPANVATASVAASPRQKKQKQKQPKLKRQPQVRATGGTTSPHNPFMRVRTIALFVVLPVVVLGGIGYGLLNIKFSNGNLEFGGPAPVATLNLNSNPVGAQISLNGQAVGATPAKLQLQAGKNQIVLKKDGFTGYEIDLQVGAAAQSGSGLPTYSLNPELWSDKATLSRLPQPIPNASLQYVRYLAADPDKLELTEMGADGQPMAAGVEGLPTNLWLYDHSFTTTTTNQAQQIHPIELDYSTLQAIETYYSPSLTNPVTLGQMVFTSPVLDPSANNLAFVSKSPFGSSDATASNNGQSLTPTQTNETIWVKRMGAEPSPGGALLTLSQAQLPALRLFSTDQLAQLLPGLIPAPAPSQSITSTNQLQQNQKYAATIEQLSWSPQGNTLLAVVRIALPGMSAGGNGNAGNGNNIVTAIIEIGVGGGYPPGAAWLVTPQPLPLEIMPGTFNWSPDAKAVSFLVERSNPNGDSSLQNVTSLCVLDLDYAARQQAQAQNGNDSSLGAMATATPLHYLADVTGGGAWGGDTSYRNNLTTPGDSSLAGGHVYPLPYSFVRYNPFAWPQSSSSSTPVAIKGTSTNGTFGAAAPAWAMGPGGSYFDTLFSYNGSIDTVGKLITSLKPLLDLGQPSSPASGGAATKGKDTSASFRQDSYPFWQVGEHPFYLSGQLTSPSKALNGSSNSSSSNAKALQIMVRQLPDASFANVNISGGNDNNNNQIQVIKELHGSLTLPTFDGAYSSSSSSSGSGIANRFEAEWQPGGRGLLLALPDGSSYNGGVTMWLVNW